MTNQRKLTHKTKCLVMLSAFIPVFLGVAACIPVLGVTYAGGHEKYGINAR